MQIKTIMRYHFTPVRLAIISHSVAVGEVVEKKKPSFTAGRNVNGHSHYGKQYEDPSKK